MPPPERVLNQTSKLTVIEAWILVPALVVAASGALGWLLGRLTGRDLGALTVPAGFLAGIAVMSAPLSLGISGRASVALVALIVVVGVVGAVRELRRAGARPRVGGAVLWPAGALLAAYAIGLAPVVGSGHSAVLGYQMNGDSAVHVTVIEEIARHNARANQPNLDSPHAATKDLEAGYPLGSYAWPLFARVLTGVGVFHLWVPLSAVVLGLMALVAYDLLRRLLVPRAFAAAAGTLAGVGYLTYSYHGQGGTKEVLVPLAANTMVALAARAIDGPADTRSLLPAGVAAAAAIANLGYGGLAWVGPTGLGIAALLGYRAWRERSYERLKPLAAALGVVILLGLPALIRTLGFFGAASHTISLGAGNLFGGVPFREALNVWLAHDYRHVIPDAIDVTDIGVWLAGGFAVVGALWALRRRDLGLPFALFAALLPVIVITSSASIYFDAKTYVAAAPVLGVATAAGVYALARGPGVLRVLGIAAGVLLAFGALVSDAYVYSGVWVTPRFRYDELGSFADRLRGQGPVLVNDGDEWAAYILRDSKPWTEHALRNPGGRWANPKNERPIRPLDPDDYAPRHIETFPYILDRKSPYGSRPPANYVQVAETKRYALWHRVGPGPIFHLPYGVDGYVGTNKLLCRRGRPLDPGSRFMFAVARSGKARLRAAVGPREPIVAVDPHRWVNYKPVALFKPRTFIAMTGGSASAGVTVPPGRYYAWIAGSLGPGIGVWVRDERTVPYLQVGFASNDMGLPALWQPIAQAGLTHHTIVHVSWTDRGWWKASSRHPNVIGPLVFTRLGDRARVVSVPAARVGSLCGKRLDWLEAYKT